jgi:hypothetical protein
MSSMKLPIFLFCFLWTLHYCAGLVIPIPAAQPAVSLRGVTLERANPTTTSDGNAVIGLGQALAATASNEKTLLVLGTHPADFNMVEYAQKIGIYWNQLQAKGGITRCIMVMNGQVSSCQKLAALLELPAAIEIYADPTGEAGRSFGVSRGFRPDDTNLPPFLKTTVVGLGFGPPWMTLPAVLPGYFGDPNGTRDWIEQGLKQGQLAGRWPSVLDLDTSEDDAIITGNKFDDFPLVSGWGRRPFELATLRLQNLIGIQIKHWDALKPIDDRCLSQLGGCAVVGENGEALYSWVDQGLCDVPDIDDIIKALA